LLTPTSTLGALIAGLVLTYSAARYVPASRLVVAAVAIAGGVGVHRAATAGSGPVDVLFDLFFLAAAWGVGRGLRRRQAQTDQLVAERDSVIEHAEQRTSEAIARERGRIARELHDVVAHCLSIIAVQAGAAEQVVETDPAKARQAMLAVREVSQQAMVEMRRLVGLMRTTPVDDDPAAPPQPRLGQLDTLISQLSDATLPVTLERTGSVRALPHGVELCAFRIVQEALTNVVKHAGPVTTTVRLDYGPDQLHIIVADTGTRGGGEPGIGHGLLGMRERAAAYGGRITAGPDPDGGFVVDARLPCPAGTVAGATTPTPP
jgi:signal transduction histidine kinase